MSGTRIALKGFAARAVALGLTLTGLTFTQTAAEAAETEVRVAMTAADIPDWTGAPDQGYEGFRFAGFTLYDSLVNWDLSSSEKAADITPGLAESWDIDPADHKRWLFKLRQNVKFHDGCSWNADAAVWNFKRIKDETAPQHNVRHQTMQGWTITNVEKLEKVDDYTVALTTYIVDSLLPYQLAGYFQISPCALEAVNYNYEEYAKKPSGTGPYKFDKVVPRERLELVKNPDYWNPARVPKHDRLVLLPMPEATTRAAALLAGQVDFVEAPSPDTIPRLKDAGMNIILVPYPHNWDYQIRVDMPPSTMSASGVPPTTPSTGRRWWRCCRASRWRGMPSSSRRSSTTATPSDTNTTRRRRRRCWTRPVASRAR